MQDLTPCLKPSLAELQQQLRGAITRRGVNPLDVIVDAAPLPAAKRLEVYSDAYFLRLLDCLASDFPAVRRVLGAEAFHGLAADYLRKHPSSSPNVSDLGESLPEFSLTHPLVTEFSFLPDLIRLEWAALQSLFTDRLPALDPSAPQNVPADAWPRARLTLDPTVRLLKTDWAVDMLWEKRREPEKRGRSRLKSAKPRRLLLYRDDAWLQVRVIDEPRWYALSRLKEGTSLGKVCEELAEQFPRRRRGSPKAAHQSLPVMEWFTHWVHAGLIKKIEV